MNSWRAEKSGVEILINTCTLAKNKTPKQVITENSKVQSAYLEITLIG